MEARDTVMENLAQAIISHPELPMGKAVAIEQAEISFKAGLKEVVEWVEAHIGVGLLYAGEFMPCEKDQRPSDAIMDYSGWQAKKKEWGI